MPKKTTRTLTILATIIGFVVVVILFLGLLPTITGKPVSNSDLENVSLSYVKSRCHMDTKRANKDDKFCNDIKVVLGDKVEDAAAVTWNVTARRSDTNQIYSSFDVVSNNGNPKVNESTYVLNIGQ